MGGVPDQGHAFLPVQPAHVGDDRAEVVPQPQPVTQGCFHRVLALDVVGAVADRDQRVDLRVPHLVVDAVEHAAELAVMDVQGVPQPPALLGVHGLPRMLRRDRRDEVRVDDAAFHQIDGAGVEVVLQPGRMEEVPGRVSPVAHSAFSPATPWWLKLCTV